MLNSRIFVNLDFRMMWEEAIIACFKVVFCNLLDRLR